MAFSTVAGRAREHQQQGQWRAAEADYLQALKQSARGHVCQEDTLAVLNNLGMVVQNQGRFDEAEVIYRKALGLSPSQPEVCCNLAGILRLRGRVGEAMALYLSALRAAPENSLCLNNLGNAYKELGRFREAAALYRKAMAAAPKNPMPLNNLGSVLSELGDAAEAVVCFRRALDLDPHYLEAFSNLLLGISYLSQVDLRSRFLAHRQFDSLFCRKPLRVSPVHRNAPDPERPLRIGFVSGDFGTHPLAFFLEPVFENLDRSAFQIFGYSNRPGRDEVTERFQSLANGWREVFGVDDETVARWVREDEVDILIDLSGHTAGNRLLVFAEKPAPVNVTMAGYMQTTGMSAMDYRITSEAMDPYGLVDEFYSERLVRISALPAFAVPANCPPVESLPASRNAHVTFASLNNLSKVGPRVMDAWAEILKAVPSSKMTVVGREGNNLVPALEARGVDSSRIRMLNHLPMQDYLALHNELDILLDPFPFNGGTTSFFASWMGVPMVSLAGEGGQSRFGALLLKALQMEELLVSSTRDYVLAAVGLANDVSRLGLYRRQMRGRMEVLLGNGSGYTKELEKAFRTMWQEWCARRQAPRSTSGR